MTRMPGAFILEWLLYTKAEAANVGQNRVAVLPFIAGMVEIQVI